MSIGYLTRLTLRMLLACAKLAPHRQTQWTDFFLEHQCSDGGFRGRRGQSDLYYSMFGLRALFLLGKLDHAHMGKTIDFLNRFEPHSLDAADLNALVFSLSLLHGIDGTVLTEPRRRELLACILRLRREDGCFATSVKTNYSSSYQTFLSAIAFELLDAKEYLDSIPVKPILARQCSDGGFVELEKLHRSGTNPTAAAIGFLTIKGKTPDAKDEAARFLLRRQGPDGGFAPNSLITLSDLLSSFTALLALEDLGQSDQCNRAALKNFVQEMESPNGGYRANAMDSNSDIEYTFYGLALEALLAETNTTPL